MTRSSASSSSRDGSWASGRAIRRDSTRRPGAPGEPLAERQRRRARARRSTSGRARRSFVGSGGHGANPQFRSMFYPAFSEPAFVSSGWALLGPRGQDASGIIAGMRVGANLAGMQQNLGRPSTFHIPAALATRDSYTDMLPGHPTFPFRGSTGITLGTELLRAPDRREPGGQALLQRNGCREALRQRRVCRAGHATAQPKPALEHVQSTGAMRSPTGSGRSTAAIPTAFTPRWR